MADQPKEPLREMVSITVCFPRLISMSIANAALAHDIEMIGRIVLTKDNAAGVIPLLTRQFGDRAKFVVVQALKQVALAKYFQANHLTPPGVGLTQ